MRLNTKPIYYDNAPFLNPKNTWSDPEEAEKLSVEIGTDYSYEDGCRWSVIYTLNGITLILISFNMILYVVGAMKMTFRLVASLCGCCLCCVNFAAIIVTGVFRLN